MPLEQNPEGHGQYAQDDRCPTTYAHFLAAVGFALTQYVGVKVMGDGRRTRQGQAGHHGKDGGEGDGCEEPEHQVAAQGLRQVHDRHVHTAK
ncbi:hypothetical protein D3C73_1429440 [compost metagenome]